ncbi:unnamed protein product [Lampetra planeri]
MDATGDTHQADVTEPGARPPDPASPTPTQEGGESPTAAGATGVPSSAAAPGSTPSPTPMGGEEVTTGPEGSGLPGLGNEPSGTLASGGSVEVAEGACADVWFNSVDPDAEASESDMASGAGNGAPEEPKRGDMCTPGRFRIFLKWAYGRCKVRVQDTFTDKGAFMKMARMVIQDPHRHGFNRRGFHHFLRKGCQLPRKSRAPGGVRHFRPCRPLTRDCRVIGDVTAASGGHSVVRRPYKRHTWRRRLKALSIIASEEPHGRCAQSGAPPRAHRESGGAVAQWLARCALRPNAERALPDGISGRPFLAGQTSCERAAAAAARGASGGGLRDAQGARTSSPTAGGVGKQSLGYAVQEVAGILLTCTMDPIE